MKSLLLFCIGLFITTVIIAQVSGPSSGNTFTTAALAGSSQSWVNTSNVAASDDVYSDFSDLAGAVGTHTDYLVATNFGFSIPSAVIITGILVEIERSDSKFHTSDYSIKIVKGGTITGSEHSSGAAYPTTDSYYPVGGSNDLWGTTWTDADINASNFGVAIAAQRDDPAGTTRGRIDNIRITVYYNFIILPLNLKSFTALPGNKMVHLSWTTTDETNTNHFELERSANGRDFSRLGSIASTNQMTVNNYSFDDNNPLTGIAWYRLAIISNNSTVKYSMIIAVQMRSDKGLSLYPNPWTRGTDLLINNVSNQRLSVQFFNTSGQMSSNVIVTTNYVPMQTLLNTKGMMFYKVFDEKNILQGTGILFVN
jgi:hypothetical protein